MTTAHVAVTLAICVGFAALLTAGVQYGRDFTETMRVALLQSGVFGPDTRLARIAPLLLLDPRSEFSETRVGYLMHSTRNSDMCRRVLFDNRSGASADAGQIHCGQPPEKTDQVGQERAQAMLRAFRK